MRLTNGRQMAPVAGRTTEETEMANPLIRTRPMRDDDALMARCNAAIKSATGALSTVTAELLGAGYKAGLAQSASVLRGFAEDPDQLLEGLTATEGPVSRAAASELLELLAEAMDGAAK